MSQRKNTFNSHEKNTGRRAYELTLMEFFRTAHGERVLDCVWQFYRDILQRQGEERTSETKVKRNQARE